MVEIASIIEHTLLRPTATADDVEGLCREAREHEFLAVCVNSLHVRRARAALEGSSCRVVSVAGFPLGASAAEVAAEEASYVLAHGADEVDMVVPLGLALSGDAEGVTRYVDTVRRAAAGATLKVILETGHFDAPTLRRVCEWVLLAKPDFLKTATGFGPRGARVEDVRLLASVAAGRAGVKAAGGIRSRDEVLAMLAAGATRIGTSNGVAVVGGGSPGAA